MSELHFELGKSFVGTDFPTYFIADLASNHGGDLEIARELIREAAAAGANAAKFQHFRADTLVSMKGFQEIGRLESHQLTWDDSVFETYRKMEVPESWTQTLAKECEESGIEFLTSPYDIESIDYLDRFLPAYKVGSGDLTFHESILKMASKGKPMLIATGASTFYEVSEIVSKVQEINTEIILMQCNTNYTGVKENSDFVNLRVLEQYKKKFPNIVLGLSDHTKDDLTIIGAVALGARVIEKHFKGINSPKNPDLDFSLSGDEWSKMVNKVRRLERALGNGEKSIEKNEIITRILQRRSTRYARKLELGHVLEKSDLVFLRPAPLNSLSPAEASQLIGQSLNKQVESHDLVEKSHFYPYLSAKNE